MSGKLTTCTRCGSGQAEYYSANYIHCTACESPEADTDPGFVPAAFVPATQRIYKCTDCSIAMSYYPSRVLAGQTCKICAVGFLMIADPRGVVP